jgi:hypothetical protein
MSKGKNRKSSTIPVQDPHTPAPGAPTARKNKAGTEITVHYKGLTAVLPSLLHLPYEIVNEYFEFEELPEAEQKKATTKLFRKLTNYFITTSEDFKAISQATTFPETLACTVTWINANGNGATLGK